MNLPTGNGKDEMSLTGPGGISAAIKGPNIILVFLFACFVLITLYLNYRDHQALLDEMRIQSYLQSLPLDRRPPLNPPNSLWERMQKPHP